MRQELKVLFTDIAEGSSCYTRINIKRILSIRSCSTQWRLCKSVIIRCVSCRKEYWLVLIKTNADFRVIVRDEFELYLAKQQVSSEDVTFLSAENIIDQFGSLCALTLIRRVALDAML